MKLSRKLRSSAIFIPLLFLTGCVGMEALTAEQIAIKCAKLQAAMTAAEQNRVAFNCSGANIPEAEAAANARICAGFNTAKALANARMLTLRCPLPASTPIPTPVIQ